MLTPIRIFKIFRLRENKKKYFNYKNDIFYKIFTFSF